MQEIYVKINKAITFNRKLIYGGTIMNKTLIYTGLGLLIVIGGSYTYFSSNSDKAQAVSTQEVPNVSPG